MRLISILVIVGSLIFGLWFFKIIGFCYPVVVQNQPIDKGVMIVSRKDNVITLQNGVILTLSDELTQWKKDKCHLKVGDSVRMEFDSVDGEITVFALVDGWVCGTPWAQPIRIPIIRQVVYRNTVEAVAFATQSTR